MRNNAKKVGVPTHMECDILFPSVADPDPHGSELLPGSESGIIVPDPDPVKE